MPQLKNARVDARRAAAKWDEERKGLEAEARGAPRPKQTRIPEPDPEIDSKSAQNRFKKRPK